MLYDLSKLNMQIAKKYFSGVYDRHGSNSCLIRVRITRRVLSVLHLHPDWDEDMVFCKVQDVFRKGKGSDMVRTIDREFYNYFKQNWREFITLEDVESGKEYEHYAKWSNVRLTQEQYIAKARAKWGDAYDYSESVYIAGLKPITIRCIRHNHYFTVQAGNHISTSNSRFSGGCPLCAKERVDESRRKTYKEHFIKVKQIKKANSKSRMSSQERFLLKAQEMYPNYDFSLAKYTQRESYIIVVCPVHGEFKITPRVLLRGNHGSSPHGCWKCNGMIPPYEKHSLLLNTFKSRMYELYGDKYTFAWNDLKEIGKSTQIRFNCKQHGEQHRAVNDLLEGKGCKYCNGSFYPLDWLKNARAVHGDKYEYDESRPPRISSDYIRYKCPIHGWQETRYDCHVKQRCGCALCAGVFNKLSVEKRKQIWIERSKERFPNKFSYRDVVYVNNDTPVKIYCKEHRLLFEVLPDSHVRGAGGCPLCTKSIGEVEIYKWLHEQNITFETQKKLPNESMFCKRQYLVVDFFLPNFNLIIEMNGVQHYHKVEHFNTKDWTFEDQQIRDETLRAYCRIHKVKLLEIKYDEVDRIPKILAKAIEKFRKTTNI